MRHSLLALALCLNGSVAAQGLDLRLPDFGDPSAQHLGRHQEAQLGAEMMQRLRQRGVLIEDVQLAEYLDSVGQRIATGAGGGHPYTFFWVDDDRINAFAAPGSYVGVNTGLLLATRNEAEFAGVVAHEVAHVAQRHIARRYAEARRLQLPVAAALAASAALAAASGEAGQAAMASTLAASAQRQISYTRGSEQEADRVGQRLLEQAGFDPRGMASFFAFLARSPEEAANQLPDYLRTHPSPDDRLAQSSRFEDNAPLAPGSEAYRLARVRARVLTTTNTTQLGQWFQERLAAGDGPGESALRYGYALTLRRAGRYEEAAAQLESLLRREPDRLAFRIEQAELALARGEAERAWSLFERILTLYPDNYVATVHYSQALAAQGDPRRAMRLLDPYRQRRSRDPLLFQLYARAAQRAGERPAMYGALAEFHYLNGELEQAIEQAERGLAQGGSPYEKAQLQARLRDYRAARR